MATLYMMCGVSGSGKTTWAEQYMIDHSEENICYVSRDEIRFMLLQDDEDYFAHEKEVFQKFTTTIATLLKNGSNVIADATHLNKYSRKRLTDAIDYHFNDYDIIYVSVNCSYQDCIAHNAMREGRSFVDEKVIAGMFRSWQAPDANEDKRAFMVINVGEPNKDYDYLLDPYKDKKVEEENG